MKNKALILTSLTALTFAVPAMADPNIAANANSAQCTQPVLGTTSGTSNLQANWSANTLNIDWYNGDDKITSTSCSYDGGITIPSEDPEKTGYTFNGWTIRRASAAPAQQCDFSGLSDTTTKGRSPYAYASHDGTSNSNMDTYGLTQGSGEWAVEFYHGIVKGMARCSTVGDGYSEGQTGNPTDDLNQAGAQYCWCQMTGYTPKPWIYDTGDASTSPIYLTGYTNQSSCRAAIKVITGLNTTNANTLLNNASSENPQLITNATGANLAYLTESGCTTSGGATGHFGEMGNACPVSSRWVFYNDYGSAAICARDCAGGCGNYVQFPAYGRSAVFGAATGN